MDDARAQTENLSAAAVTFSNVKNPQLVAVISYFSTGPNESKPTLINKSRHQAHLPFCIAIGSITFPAAAVATTGFQR